MLTDSFVTVIEWGGLWRVRQGEGEKRREDHENTKHYFNKEKVVSPSPAISSASSREKINR